MPKVKISDLLVRLENLEKNIKERENDTVENIIQNIIDTNERDGIRKTILRGIEGKLGREKAEHIIDSIFFKMKDRDPNFDSDGQIREYSDKVIINQSRLIINEALKKDSNFPGKDKILALNERLGVHDMGTAGAYGYKKYYEQCLAAAPEVLEHFKQNVSVVSAISTAKIDLSLIPEILKNPDANIDLEEEIDDYEYPVNMEDKDLVAEYKPGLIDSLKDLPGIKDNGEKLAALDEVKIHSGTSRHPNDVAFNDLRDKGEPAVTKAGKAIIGTKTQDELDKYYEFKNIGTDQKPKFVTAAKDNDGKRAEEFRNDCSIILDEKSKEGLRKGLEMIEEMKLPLVGGEQGGKRYGFSMLAQTHDKLCQKLDEIEGVKRQLEEKTAAIAAAEGEAKLTLEVEKVGLEGSLETMTNELVSLNTEYNEHLANVDKLGEHCKTYFANKKTLNTNVDISRNNTMPTKYRKDFVTASQINGLVYAYSLMKANNLTIDEFVADPGKATLKGIDNYFDKDNIQLKDSDKDLDLTHQLMKINDYNAYSNKSLKGDIENDLVLRGLDFVVSLDNENYVHNQLQWKKLVDASTNLYNFTKDTSTLIPDKADFFEKVIFTEGIPAKDFIKEPYVDPVTLEVISPKPFDLNQYLNTHEVSPDQMLENYNAIVDSIVLKNDTTNPNTSANAKRDSSKDIAYATEALATATLKYMQMNQIDPEKVTDPALRKLIYSIENPEDFITNVMGIKDFDNSRLPKNQKDEIDKLKLTALDRRKAEEKLENLERTALFNESKFDREFAKYNLDYQKKVDDILKEPKEDNYERIKALKLQRREVITQHIAELKQQLLENKIPFDFYLNRIEQVDKGEPLGDLKFFNKPTKFKRENAVYLVPKRCSLEDIQELENTLRDIKNVTIDQIAREDKKLFNDLPVKPAYDINLGQAPIEDKFEVIPDELIDEHEELEFKDFGPFGFESYRDSLENIMEVTNEHLNGMDFKDIYIDAWIKNYDATEHHDMLYDELLNELSVEDFIKINREIYGENFEKNEAKIAFDSNKGHFYKHFDKNSPIYDGIDLKNIGGPDNTTDNEKYINFLEGLHNEFIAKGMTDEEILNDPKSLDYIENLRKKSELRFRLDNKESLAEKLNDEIKYNNPRTVTEEMINAQREADKVFLGKALKSARLVMNSKEMNVMAPSVVPGLLHNHASSYGLDQVEKNNYIKKVLAVAPKYVAKEKLDEVAKKVSLVKNASEMKGFEATKENIQSEKINSLIQDVNEGKIAIPEGMTKEEVLETLNSITPMVTSPDDRAYKYMNSYGNRVDAHNQHLELAKTFNFFKKYEGGKFYQMYDEERLREVDLTKNSTTPIIGNLIPEKEKYLEDYKKLKPEFSLEYVEKLKRIFAKINSMKIYPEGQIAQEEGTKAYGFRKLNDANYHLRKAIDEGNFKDIKKYTEEYKKEYNDIKELFDMVKEINPKTVSGNVGTERNELIPYEFSSDYATTSMLNSYVILATYLNVNKISIEDYVKDPGMFVRRDLQRYFDNHGPQATMNKLKEDYPGPLGKAAMIATLSSVDATNTFSGPAFRMAKSSSDRGMLGIVDGEPNEALKDKGLAYMHMINSSLNDNAITRISDRIRTLFDDPVTVQNLLLVKPEDIDINQLQKEYIDQDGRKITNPPFDHKQYILDNDITARDLYNQSLEYFQGIQQIVEEDLAEGYFASDKVIDSAIVGAVRNMGAYLVAHPEERETEYGKKMVEFINDPLKKVYSTDGLWKHDGGKEIFTLKNNPKRTKEINDARKDILDDLRNQISIEKDFKELVQEPFEKSEKELNSVLSSLIKDIKGYGKKVAQGKDIDRNTTRLYQVTNKYKMFVADKTLELLDRYQKGLLPKEYVMKRIDDFNHMNIKDEKPDIFAGYSKVTKDEFRQTYKGNNLEQDYRNYINQAKASALKEKNILLKEYRDAQSGKNIKREIPENLDLAIVSLDKTDGDLIQNFTSKEQQIINKSYNKDLYNNPEKLPEKYNKILNIEFKKGAIEEVNQAPARQNIAVDLNNQPRQNENLNNQPRQEAPQVEAQEVQAPAEEPRVEAPNQNRVQLHIDLGDNQPGRLSVRVPKQSENHLEKDQEKGRDSIKSVK